MKTQQKNSRQPHTLNTGNCISPHRNLQYVSEDFLFKNHLNEEVENHRHFEISNLKPKITNRVQL